MSAIGAGEGSATNGVETITSSMSAATLNETRKAPVEEAEEQTDREAAKEASEAENRQKALNHYLAPVATSSVPVNVMSVLDTSVPAQFTNVKPVSKWVDMAFPANIKGILIDAMTTKFPTPWPQPTAIQEYALPYLLGNPGKVLTAILGQGANGSGKTATFTLAAVSKMDFTKREPQIIVVASTHFLLNQIARDIHRITEHLSIMPEARTLAGSSTKNPRILRTDRDVKNYDAEIIVGTEAGVFAAIKGKQLRPNGVRMLIVDEADAMLKEQRGVTICKLHETLPEDVQVLLFSASMTSLDLKQGDRVALENLDNLVDVKEAKAQESIIKVSQPPSLEKTRVVHFKALWDTESTFFNAKTRDDLINDKCIFLNKLLKETGYRTVVFCKSNKDVVTIGEKLKQLDKENKLGGIGLIFNKKKVQGATDAADPTGLEERLELFRKDTLNVLVGTGAMSKGIHLVGLQMVVNFDIPMIYNMPGQPDVETFQHQCGRVGRLNQTRDTVGACVHFVGSKQEFDALNKLGTVLDAKFPELPCMLEDIPAGSTKRVEELAHEKIEAALDVKKQEAI